MSLQTCLIKTGWIMATRLNIFTKTEQVEFILVSLCHDQFIEYHHYCLSLARPNDMKMIIVQECRGLSWNLQIFYSTGEDKVKWALLLVQQLFIWESLNIFIVVFSSVWINKNKKKFRETQWNILEFLVFHKQANKKGKAKMRKTIYTGKLPTSKRRTRKSFSSFFLVLLLSMHRK